MISVEGDFVRTCCTGEGEFGIKRGNNGVLAGFVLFLAGIKKEILKCHNLLFICRQKFCSGAVNSTIYTIKNFPEEKP